MHVFKQGVERLPRGGRTRRALLLHARVGGNAAINAVDTVERPTVESFPTYPVIVGLKRSGGRHHRLANCGPGIEGSCTCERASEGSCTCTHLMRTHRETQSQHWGQTACPIFS